MAFDFNKYCVVETSPTTVLPSLRCHSEIANSKLSGNPNYVNDTPSLGEDFEIEFSDCRSASYRDVRPKRNAVQGNEVVKRGSIYQSSKETWLLQKIYASVNRSKIEFSHGTPSPLSFGIIDSLCCSDEDSSLEEETMASLMSLSEQYTTSVCGNQVDSCSYDSIITSESVTGPREEDLAVDLHNSFSVKTESDGSRANSSRAHLSPVKKMLDPFVKSKPPRGPLSSFSKTGGEMTSGISGISSKKTVSRSLVREERENPAHLQGLLKQRNKHGVPYFQFSVNSPEDAYVAKTWKAEDASSWVYTFHSLPHKKTHNTSRWGFKEINRESSIVGKMQVSCHLCTESKGARESNDFMVTEFVLYNSSCSTDVIKPSRPEMEIAAIVMQVPLEKRESLKFKTRDMKVGERPPNLVELFRLGESEAGIFDNSSLLKMHVVIPSGNHGFPVTQSCGPSPLLDRWRLGGGCDCGGWDLACPLNIFSNPTLKFVERQPVIDYQNSTQLFVQGRKDDIPAFTMRAIEDGKYTVDFHAQLSSLQVFSICVAILHAADASTIVEQAINKQIVQSDVLKVFAKEEIKTMLDAVEEEEKSEVDMMKHVLPSFVLNPPFSPIARV